MAIGCYRAKAVHYFVFGPEYLFPGNGYSDMPYNSSAILRFIIKQQQTASAMVAAAEPVLWRARRAPATAAILCHRSSQIWDPSGPDKWENLTEFSMSYQADQYGLYLALAVHGGVPVDLVDEDALLDADVLGGYSVLFVTQPNVPAATIAAVKAWATTGRGWTKPGERSSAPRPGHSFLKNISKTSESMERPCDAVSAST
jgi:hypothetical protein